MYNPIHYPLPRPWLNAEFNKHHFLLTSLITLITTLLRKCKRCLQEQGKESSAKDKSATSDTAGAVDVVSWLSCGGTVAMKLLVLENKFNES